MIKENEQVWTYWEGEEIPYIELCYETIKKYCPDIIRLTPETIGNYLDLPESYFNIKLINHKVDYLKANLIYKYGGWWLDADTIIMKSLPNTQTVTASNRNYFGCAGFFGGAKGATELRKWVEHLESAIKNRVEFSWFELISPVKDPGAFRNIDQRYMMPIVKPDSFFIKGSIEKDRLKDCLGITLYNTGFPDWFRKVSKEEVLKGDYLIASLLRNALDLPEIENPKFIELYGL